MLDLIGLGPATPSTAGCRPSPYRCRVLAVARALAATSVLLATACAPGLSVDRGDGSPEATVPVNDGVVADTPDGDDSKPGDASLHDGPDARTTRRPDGSSDGSSQADGQDSGTDAVPVRFDLLRPASAGPHPVLVYLHGGGWNMGSRRDAADDFIVKLVADGIAVMRLDYRKTLPTYDADTGQQPHPYHEQDPGHRYPAPLYDVDCALRMLVANKSRYHVDPERIFLGGYSAGGHLALTLALAHDTSRGYRAPACAHAASYRLQKVISIAGPTDLTTFRFEPRLQPLLDALVDSAQRQAASPLWHAQQLEAGHPTSYALVYSSGDDVVSFETQFVPFRAQMTAADVAVQTLVFDDPMREGGHAFGFPPDHVGEIVSHNAEIMEWISTWLSS